MKNIWLTMSQAKAILKFINTNGTHHLRNCSTFYHSKKHSPVKLPVKRYETFYIGVVELMNKMGYSGQIPCWIVTDPDTAEEIRNVIVANSPTVSRQLIEFVGLINGAWWLYSCPLMQKTKKFCVSTIIVGGAIRTDGSAQTIGALELS